MSAEFQKSYERSFFATFGLDWSNKGENGMTKKL